MRAAARIDGAGSRPMRWGILSAGNIARKFAGDLAGAGIEVAAVASRNRERAESFASDMGIPRYYGSYLELLDDAGIDAVYIALPNHLHAEWSIRCAEVGKHILCEKPAFLSGSEGEAVAAAVNSANVFFMEGFMYRFHPLWERVAELIDSGRIGKVRLLHSAFCYDMGFKPDNIRQSFAAGGGALTDVGCYCLSFSRMLAGEEPSGLRIFGRMGEETRVDEWDTANLSFPSGLSATFHCAIRVAEPHLAVIYGDKGRIEIPSPWHPHKDSAAVQVFDGRGKEVMEMGDGLPLFAREALYFARCVESGAGAADSLRDSLGQARALERLRADLLR